MKQTRNAVTRVSHQVFDNKGRNAAAALRDGYESLRSGIVNTFRTPAEAAESPDISPEVQPNIQPGSPPPSQPAFQPASTPGSPDGFPPLAISRKGARARVENAAEKLEWTTADFASEFLAWVAANYPSTAGATISSHDIATSFFPRFKSATGRHHLALGSLLRGLNDVIKPHPYKYTDGTGRRRTGTEYLVPKHRRC